MHNGYLLKKRVPEARVRIEYEDEYYIFISSAYKHKTLKKDIECIKRPINIIITYKAQ